MESNVFQCLSPRSPPSTIPIQTCHSTTTTQTRIIVPRRRPSLTIRSINGGSNDETPQPSVTPPPTITPPQTVEIRFKRGSRRRRERREGSDSSGQPAKAQASEPSPKKWEDMALGEKAIELYVGEKGLLFWLNKFAYASIFIVIGGWILFRFVGPALNLYQLDTPALSPTSMFKG